MRVLLALDIFRDYLVSDARKEDLMILLNKMDDVGDQKYIDKGTKQYLFLKSLILSESSIPIPHCKDVRIEGVPQMDDRYKAMMKSMLTDTIERIKKKNQNKLKKNEHSDIASAGFEYFALFYQLHLLKNGAVDGIISDDLLFHQVAKELKEADRVFYSEEYMERVVSDCLNNNYNNVAIKKVRFKDINVNQSFFDSYRDEYVGFNDWFQKKSDEYVYVTIGTNDELTSFLYLKYEGPNDNCGDIVPRFKNARRLKIGSFKVMLNGVKTGEAYFKIIFEEALKQKVDEIYVTVFDTYSNRRRLISRLERWGFSYYGTKEGNELVYVRDFNKKALVKCRLSYPFHKIGNINYLIPLSAQYEEDLFGDIHSRKTGVYNNPIRKLLILRQVEIPHGSIILFYSKSKNRIASVGISEYCRHGFTSFRDFIVFIKRRTTFSQAQLKELWESQVESKLVAVKFLNVCQLMEADSQIILDNLKKLNLDYMQEELQLDFEKFRMIIKGTDYEKNYVVD